MAVKRRTSGCSVMGVSSRRGNGPVLLLRLPCRACFMLLVLESFVYITHASATNDVGVLTPFESGSGAFSSGIGPIMSGSGDMPTEQPDEIPTESGKEEGLCAGVLNGFVCIFTIRNRK